MTSASFETEKSERRAAATTDSIRQEPRTPIRAGQVRNVSCELVADGGHCMMMLPPEGSELSP